MCNRLFWAGILVGVAFTSAAFGGLYWSNRPKINSDIAEKDGEFVEVRLRVARSSLPAVEQKFQQSGVLQNSGRVLDVAIEGEGYYQFKSPNGGISFSRRGDFTVSSAGSLVSKEGYLLFPEVTLPEDSTSFTVGSDGTIVVSTSEGNGEPIIIGQMVIAKFMNPGGLIRDHSGYLLETAESGQPKIGKPGLNGFGFLRQGFTLDNQDAKIANVFQYLASLAADGLGSAMKTHLPNK